MFVTGRHIIRWGKRLRDLGSPTSRFYGGGHPEGHTWRQWIFAGSSGKPEPALVNRAQEVSARRLRSSRSYGIARRRHSHEGPAASRRRYHCPSRGCLVNRSRNCTRCRVPPFRRRYHCPESGCHLSRRRGSALAATVAGQQRLSPELEPRLLAAGNPESDLDSEIA